MYRLQKLNVEKIAGDENARDKLIAQGFKLIENQEKTMKVKNNEGKK